MPERPTERFAALFVELTGSATIEERQTDAADNRVADADVAADVAKTARQTGLDDAITAPENH